MTNDGFPYTNVPKVLEKFVKMLSGVGVPPKIDRKYLKQMGFSSSNHHSFIAILKRAGLLDSAGAPTDAYKMGLRGGAAGKALVAAAIREGYDELYQTYPDAQTQPKEVLATFIGAHTGLGSQAVSAAVSTFLVMCTFGDFENLPQSGVTGKDASLEGSNPTLDQVRSDHPESSPRSPSLSAGGITVNVNIMLSVDATSDSAVYEAFFTAMAKHIKDLDGGSS